MRRIVFASLIALAIAPHASADFVDFAVGNRAGADPTPVIGHTNVGSHLFASHLPILNYVGNGTPLNDGVTVVTPAAFLCFVTGNFLDTGPAGDRWVFAPGGWLTIDDGSGVALLSGTFAGNTEVIPLEGGDFRVIASGFTGSLAPSVASFFGTLADGPGGLTILFSAPGSVPGGLFATNTLHSGNVAINPVPTPNAAILTGIGTVCITAFRLRRRAR